MAAYYNENDAKTAAWLRELIKGGLIADGEVDTRSIVDVQPSDLAGFVQCHFFAGIGGWSYALRLAEWSDDRAVWTGSCPCQPFSSAGAQAGGDDPRHLWPTWFRLIRECRPDVVFGEQVESAIAHGWIDLVFDDLEGADYAAASVGLPAACVGAFHGRSRVWFVADAVRTARERGARSLPRAQATSRGTRELNGNSADGPANGCEVGDMADATSRGFRIDGRASWQCGHAHERGSVGELGDASVRGGGPLDRQSESRRRPQEQAGGSGLSFWSDAEWIECRDGKRRPVEPGTFPLAHGLPARVGRLRGYGNAIVPQVAAEVIAAYMEIT